MLSDRTKVVRGVLAFLAGCAVLGLFMGLRGAMPGSVDPDYDSAAPLSTSSGVVVEATAAQETAALPAPEEKADEAEQEAAAEDEAKPAPAAAPAAPVVPVEAPKEEAPPADPVGELLEAPAPPPPGDLY